MRLQSFMAKLVRENDSQMRQGAFVLTRVAGVIGPVTAYHNQ